MGEIIRLKASDGHEFDAWQASPTGRPKAGLMVLQEIFGVTDHIRRITEAFASHGYLAIAPSLFDRIQPGIRLDYADVMRARDTMMKLDFDQCVLDMAATAAALRSARKVAAVGYCWGGAMADLAACQIDIDAAASYYGSRTTSWLELQPRCPVIYHFGALDPLIPAEVVEQIQGGRPNGEFHIYADAGHGFNCDERPDFRPDSAALALERTLKFFDRELAA